MIIRQIKTIDIEEVVKIHLNAFPNHFLSKLGFGFLKIYYKNVNDNDLGVILGLFENEKLLGFCAATTLSKGFNKKVILSNPFSYLIQGIKIFVTNPIFLFRLMGNITKVNDKFNDDGMYAELLSIAVAPDKQNYGIGKKLLIELESQFRFKKCIYLSLTTDFYNNEKTIGFYNSLGYKVQYDLIAYPNRKMYRMIKKLN